MTIEEIKEAMILHNLKDKEVYTALGIHFSDWYHYKRGTKPFPASRSIAAKFFFETIKNK